MHSNPPAQKTDKTDTFSLIYMWSGNSLFSIHGVSYGVSHSREGISTVCVTRTKTVRFVRLPADLRKQGTVEGEFAERRSTPTTRPLIIAGTLSAKARDLRIHPACPYVFQGSTQVPSELSDLSDSIRDAR